MSENKPDVILKLAGIVKSFSGVTVLKNIDLELGRGKVLGLVGENGAGKSTLMNILGGVLPRDSGEMRLKGALYNPRNVSDADNANIAFIHQELNLFTNLSIVENMFITTFPTKSFSPLIDYPAMARRATSILSDLGINVSPKMIVGSLSMGVRQMVEIAGALNKQAEIFILDEPTTSLSNQEKATLFRVIRQLRDSGKSIIYISHILEDVFELCDDIAVLRDGQMIGQKPSKELTREQLIKMMVGRDMHQLFPTVEKNIGESVFQVSGLSQKDKLRNVSFELKEGEIVGLFGLMGAGRTELARCLYGIDPMDAGEVRLRGTPLHPINPIACIRNGMAYVTENRRFEGLFMPKSIKDNLVCTILDRLRMNSLGVINRRQESASADEMIANLRIVLHDKDWQAAMNLSGGNQQKVVIGKWLLSKPRIFILDEPTRGVDVGAKYEIYSIINDLAKNGSSILFISSEMEELIGVCDRIMVMNKGALTAEYPKGAYSPEAIIDSAIGG